MRKKPSTMDLSKGGFIVYIQGGWWRARGGVWRQKFRDLFSWRSERGGGKWIFFSASFLWGFFVKETLHVLELRHIKACF